MNLYECLKMFPHDRYFDDLKVNPMQLAEHYYFRKNTRPGSIDYRDSALALMLAEGTDFSSTDNTTHLIHRFIDVKCIQCKGKMHYKTAHSSEHTNVIFKCDSCGTELTLCLANFSVKFKK